MMSINFKRPTHTSIHHKNPIINKELNPSTDRNGKDAPSTTVDLDTTET